MRIRNQRRVGTRRISHPHPYPLEALDHGNGAHCRGRWNEFLRRNLDTPAARVEQESVIHATDSVPFATPLRERRRAMATAILERHHLARSIPPEDQRD